MAVPNVLTENNKEELATGDLIGHWVGITSGFTGKDPIGIGDRCVHIYLLEVAARYARLLLVPAGGMPASRAGGLRPK